MYKQLLKSNKGSSLIMVMLALAILSILGIALMSLALINIKANKADENAKTSFYLSESGLDQAYQKLCVEIKAAIKYANDKIKINVDGFIAGERSKEAGDRENGIMPEDSIYIKNHANGRINPNGEVDQEKLYELLNTWFKEHYYTYFIDQGNVKLGLIEKLDNVRFGAVYEQVFSGVSEVPKVTVENSVVSQGSFDITMLSRYQHEGIARETRLTYTVTIPNYKQKYALNSEIKHDIPKNVLYAKALAAEKDIFINSSNVTINGEVYAGGNTASKPSDTGIIAGNNSRATFNGKVITGGYIKANGSNSAINLNGDVYCNTVFIPESASNSRITVGSDTESYKKYNVHTLEDLRMDGLLSNISIYGNYYGFSKGDTSDLNRSSIIINSDDFGAGSSIKITGQQPASNVFSDNSPKPAGSVIAGSSFIRLDDSSLSTPVLYQTGESVSVKGNYVAYTIGLSNDNIAEGDKGSFDEPHIYFESLNPLYIATGFDTNSDDAVDSYFGGSEGTPVQNYDIDGVTYKVYKGLNDKNKYFTYAYNQEPDLIKFGSATSLDISNVKYSTGIYIDKDINPANPTKPQQKYINGDVAPDLHKLQKEYSYYVNTMGDPQITNYLDTTQYNGAPDTKVRVENRFNFTTTIKEFIESKEIYYCSSAANKSLVIIGPGDGHQVYSPDGGWDRSSNDVYTIDTASHPNYGDASPLNGIIVTKGDVYLVGRISYRGTIITTGSIYIMDDNKKVITNDYNEAKHTAENNYVIKKISSHLKEAGDQIGDLFNSPGSQKLFVIQSTVTTSSDPDYINFEEIIKTKAWKRVR